VVRKETLKRHWRSVVFGGNAVNGERSKSLLGAAFATAMLAFAWAPLHAAPQIKSVEWLVYGPSLADGFQRPLGLAVDVERGILVVADTGRHRLVILDAKGRGRGTLACQVGAGALASCEPRAVAIGPRGRIYTLDALESEVEVLTPTGARLARFDPCPSDTLQARPQCLAVGSSGRIYVGFGGEDAGYVVLDPKGRLLSSVGFMPDGPFEGPVSIAVSPDEDAIAVVDPKAERVVSVHGSDGRLRMAFGPHGEGDGTFSVAAHVAWGPGNTLWVTDQVRQSISVFDSTGRYLGRIGGFGRGPGQFDYPIACAFLAPDRVAVLERAGSRLQVLDVEVGEAREPQTGLASPGSGNAGTYSSAEVD